MLLIYCFKCNIVSSARFRKFLIKMVYINLNLQPSVALQNSRRSPSTDLRPPIAQMAGMYPTVNMMIPGIIYFNHFNS